MDLQELLKIFYLDPDLNNLQDIAYNPGLDCISLLDSWLLNEYVRFLFICLLSWSITRITLSTLFCDPAGKKDKTDTAFQEKNGIRCVCISPDGQHLASGDRVGNLRYRAVGIRIW